MAFCEFALTGRACRVLALCIPAIAATVTMGCSEEAPPEKAPLVEERLTRNQLTDTAFLAERHASASKQDKANARKLLRQAAKAVESEKWPRAGKLYEQSLATRPTTRGLIGFANTRIELTRRKENAQEAVKAKKNDFRYASNLFDTAFKFEKQTNDTSESDDELKKARQRKKCLDTYLEAGKVPAEKRCEFIKQSLSRSRKASQSS